MMTYEQQCEIDNIDAYHRIINTFRNECDALRVDVIHSHIDETIYVVCHYDDEYLHTYDVYHANCGNDDDVQRFVHVVDERIYIDVKIRDE
jgi:hypothetical protein